MVAAVETPVLAAVGSRFVWFDLMSTDREASLTFFRDLLGWTTAAPGGGSSGAYLTLVAGNVPFGGAVHMSTEEGHPSHFIGYVACDDVDDVAARVPGLGGAVAFPPMDIPGVGRLAVLSDPMGAPFSAMTSLPGTPRAPETDVPVGGVAWSEIASRAPLRTGEFYARLFGWTLRAPASAGMADYTVLMHGDTMVAGLSDAPNADAPAGWLFYFRVADIDAATARVPQLGGAMMTGIMTIANDCRFAIATEPTGATFALVQDIA
jgi:predicted enzyme related to lactoylglutathione lyase